MLSISVILTVGVVLLLGLAALNFRKAIVLRSHGYLLFGLGDLSIALSLQLIMLDITLYVYAVFIVIAFILIQVGQLILLTREQHIYELRRRQRGFRKLLWGFYPKRDVAEAEAGEARPEKANARQAKLYGVFAIVFGIGVFLSHEGEEIIYPAFLVGTGMLFIIGDLLYARRDKKKQG
jgi:hypothetical protein